MGHDVTAFTKDNIEIDGPHSMAISGGRLYDYLDAVDHDAGASGDGLCEDMNPERLRLAIARLDEDVRVWPGLETPLMPVREFLVRCMTAGVVRIKFW